MSADDATARRLDEQLDELIARGGGELPAELAGDELAQVAHLFLVDAAYLQMENERAVRRQLLEQVALEEQRGEGLRPRFKFRSMWRVRRVAITAMCALAAMTTVAVADTKTPVGSAVRQVARAVKIPVPAEPHQPQRPDKPRGERPANGSPTDTAGSSTNKDGTAGALPPRDTGDGEFVPQGEVQGDEPMPRPEGEGEGEMLPPPDGQAPKPDGDGGTLPPPDGQQPPPDGTAPKPQPCCPQPAPGGTAPAPCCPAPAPQPAPQPLPPPQ